MIQGEDHEDEILTKKILMTRKTRWKTRRKTLTQTEDLAADPTGDPDHVPSFDLTEKIKPTMWLIMEAGQASEVEDIEDNFVAAETKVAKTKVVMTSSMTRQVIEDNVVAAETKVAKTKVVETSSMTRQIIEDNGAETKVVETSSMDEDRADDNALNEDRAKNLDQRFLEAGPEATEDPDRPVRIPQTRWGEEEMVLEIVTLPENLVEAVVPSETADKPARGRRGRKNPKMRKHLGRTTRRPRTSQMQQGNSDFNLLLKSART